MSVAMSVVFTGLCALATGGAGAPAQMLLVDPTTLGPVDGVLLPEHAPTLVVSLEALANASTSQPTRVITGWPADGRSSGSSAARQLGLWDLAGSEVRIRVQGGEATGLELYRPPAGASSWPEPPDNLRDPGAWRDVRYLAPMRALTPDDRIDPALIQGSDVSRRGLPRGVGARFYLDSGRLEAGAPSQDAQRGDVFEFIGTSLGTTYRQALTDTIQWRVESETTAVVIEIIPSDGGATRRLVFAPGTAEHTVYVSNLPAPSASRAAGRDPHAAHASAPHFAAYYKLLMNEPSQRPLPSLWVAPQASQGVAGGRPIFCGPAVFSIRR